MKVSLTLNVLLLSQWSAWFCDSFSVVPASPARSSPSLSQRIPLFAIVYGPDDEGEYTHDHGYDDYSNESNSANDLMMWASELLRTERDAFTRMAAAFSPAVGQHLKLANIDDIAVVNVNEAQMDLQAVLCEDGSCNAVMVPLRFPNPCCNGCDHYDEHHDSCLNNCNWQDCLLENLGELDEQAKELITLQQQQEQQQQERAQVADRGHDGKVWQAKEQQWKETIPMGTLEFPSWWVTAATFDGMAEECNFLQTLLNEESFESDLVAVAQGYFNNDNSVKVVEAQVAAVGPAGICMRVCTRRDIYVNGEDTVTRKSISIPFASEGMASTPDQLRDNIHHLLEVYSHMEDYSR